MHCFQKLPGSLAAQMPASCVAQSLLSTCVEAEQQSGCSLLTAAPPNAALLDGCPKAGELCRRSTASSDEDSSIVNSCDQHGDSDRKKHGIRAASPDQMDWQQEPQMGTLA